MNKWITVFSDHELSEVAKLLNPMWIILEDDETKTPILVQPDGHDNFIAPDEIIYHYCDIAYFQPVVAPVFSEDEKEEYLTQSQKRLVEIVSELRKKQIYMGIRLCYKKGMFYCDLRTEAKSHLYLYENGEIEGRYNYAEKVDLSAPTDEVILELCKHFKNAMCNRVYGNPMWIHLCNMKGINIRV